MDLLDVVLGLASAPWWLGVALLAGGTAAVVVFAVLLRDKP